MTDAYDLTVTERSRLVGILESLSEDQWNHPSLCDGWRVMDVVAHLSSAYTRTDEAFGASVEAAGGGIAAINTVCDENARADAHRFGPAGLTRIMREGIRSRWTPGGSEQIGALSHDVIHGLDITRPLGLPGPASEALHTVLAGATTESMSFFGVDLSGLQLRVEGSDIAFGDGPVVSLPGEDVLMIVCGRLPLPEPEATGGAR